MAFDFNIEFHGAVYLCSECLREAAQKADYITPEQAEKLKFQVGELESANYVLQTKVDGLERAVDGLSLARSVSGDVPVTNGGDNSSPVENAAAPTSAGNSVDNGEGASPKPSNDKKLAGLRSGERESEPDSSAFSLGL